MRRLHLALAVDDLDATIRDYSARLGSGPVAVVPGRYALWRTPEVNLSVNCDVGPGGRREHLRHLGFEDDTVATKTLDTDVNGVTWETFSAELQDEEIEKVYGKATRPGPS